MEINRYDPLWRALEPLLQQRWGDQFDTRLAQALKVLDHATPEDLADLMKLPSSVAADMGVLFAKIGAGEVRDITPQQALIVACDLADMGGDYWSNGSSPEDAQAHREARALVSRAMGVIHGEQPPSPSPDGREPATPLQARDVASYHDKAKALMMSPAYRDASDLRHQQVRADVTRLFAEAPGGTDVVAHPDDPPLPPPLPTLPPAA
jgi:hypothetical protein